MAYFPSILQVSLQNIPVSTKTQTNPVGKNLLKLKLLICSPVPQADPSGSHFCAEPAPNLCYLPPLSLTTTTGSTIILTLQMRRLKTKELSHRSRLHGRPRLELKCPPGSTSRDAALGVKSMRTIPAVGELVLPGRNKTSYAK